MDYVLCKNTVIYKLCKWGVNILGDIYLEMFKNILSMHKRDVLSQTIKLEFLIFNLKLEQNLIG